jgi:hypothetical protein
MLLLTACSTPPRQNDQQSFERDLSEASLFLKTLQALDSGDVAKARQIAMVPVLVDMASLPDYAKSHLTAMQKHELILLARNTLDYLTAHRVEFDGHLPSIQACIRGLRNILTDPEDVRRLNELSDYFEEQKP